MGRHSKADKQILALEAKLDAARSRVSGLQAQVNLPMRPLPDTPPGAPMEPIDEKTREKLLASRRAVERALQPGFQQPGLKESLANLGEALKRAPGEIGEAVAGMVDPLGAYTHMLPREVSRAVNMAKGRYSDADLLSDAQIREMAVRDYDKAKIAWIEKKAAAQAKARATRAPRVPGSAGRKFR